TLAAACWVARSRGRRVSPSGPRPAAIAPDETKTISVPAARRAASTSTSASMRPASSTPSGVVSDDDPAFTTIRRAFAIASRSLIRTSLLLGGLAPSVQAAVRSAGPGGSTAGRDLRLPVEDHRVVLAADQDRGARGGARVGERLLDAEPGQAVGEVPDGLVVGEVGLPQPPLRLLSGDQVRVVPEVLHLEVGPAVDRFGADDDAGRLRRGQRRPVLLHHR